MSAGWTPAATAISRRRAPANPRAANSRSPTSRRRCLVAVALRSRLAPGTAAPACSSAGGGVGSGEGLGRSIPVLELYHIELLESSADAGGEQAEPLHVGHDLREDELPEELHRLALVGDGQALLDR